MGLVLKMLLQQVTHGQMNIHDLNWTLIDNYAAENLHLCHSYAPQLPKIWFEDGYIMISRCSGNIESPNKMDKLDDDGDNEEEGRSSEKILQMFSSNQRLKRMIWLMLKVKLLHAKNFVVS
jgi:hypothetical protein